MPSGLFTAAALAEVVQRRHEVTIIWVRHAKGLDLMAAIGPVRIAPLSMRRGYTASMVSVSVPASAGLTKIPSASAPGLPLLAMLLLVRMA